MKSSRRHSFATLSKLSDITSATTSSTSASSRPAVKLFYYAQEEEAVATLRARPSVVRPLLECSSSTFTHRQPLALCASHPHCPLNVTPSFLGVDAGRTDGTPQVADRHAVRATGLGATDHAGPQIRARIQIDIVNAPERTRLRCPDGSSKALVEYLLVGPEDSHNNVATRCGRLVSICRQSRI